jgi:hypothetical protein
MTKDRINARITALTNAAEFIRGHGEEGGIEEDTFDFPVKLYDEEKIKVFKMLTKEADKFEAKLTKPTH